MKTKEVTYLYDVFDRRIAKDVDDDGNGSIDRGERYVYDGSDVALVYDRSDNLVERLLYGPGVDQPLASEDGSVDVLWFVADNQGTIRDVAEYDAVSGDTSVVNHITYGGFGNITSQTNSAHEPRHTYTGREWDSDSELFYYRARWYDPVVGRFISEDPIGFRGLDANLSRYVGNGSTNFIDPSGLWRGTYQDIAYFGDTGGFATSLPDSASGYVVPPLGTSGGMPPDRTLIVLSDAAIDAIVAALPDAIGSGTNRCERYEELLRQSVQSVGGSGVYSAETITFALYPNSDAPLVVQLGLATGHAALAVTFVDGRTVYFDNDFFGGDDQMFTLDDIPSYATPGTPAPNLYEIIRGNIANTATGNVQLLDDSAQAILDTARESPGIW